jgi:deoxyribonuclease (pyrimidine dimer)
MTRINLVDPVELTDQHLIAEYRETRLLTANMRKSFRLTGYDKQKIPKQFTLNAGHVTFFKNKGPYISNRYHKLIYEMENCWFTPTYTSIDTTAWPANCFNDWTPTERDKQIVRERIALRISAKPLWYRYYSKPLGELYDARCRMSNLSSTAPART